METSAVIAGAEDRVVDEAVAELDRRRTNDQASSPEMRRRHLRDLFELVVRCLHDGVVAPIIASSQQLAADRFAVGFDISEVQGEFNVLEEVLWREVAATLAGDQRIEALELLNAILGAGRDALARTYVALASGGSSSRDEQQPAAPSEGAVPGGEGSGPDAAEALGGGNIKTEVMGRVGVITLGDQHRRNAISAALANGIVAELETLRSQDVRAVVLRAATGMRVWSSGRDITELPRGRRDPLAYNDPLEELIRAVRTFPAPVIAMVHGSVWGGAFDLVLSCDVIIADETAMFAITPANLGLPYNTTGLLHFLGRLPINLIKELFFAAAPVDAQKAKEWLLVNHLVDAADLEAFTLDVAATMASKSPLAISVIKEQLRVLNDYQPIAAQVYERIQGLRREAYDSSDYLEGLNAFAEKRQPVFRGT
ncbi:MAG: methylmalonyl-CoA decarboxylase [Acidimicrobiales bacterium]|jgi:methylmalonyl-CoA decarboxylase